MILIDQAKIVGRDNLYKLLPDTPTSRGVEVGTHKAEFAAKLLSGWSGTLFCVDPYLYKYDDGDPTALGNRDNDRREAHQRLKRFGRRARLIEKTSAEAVCLFEDNSLDFVYIDGNHRRQYVAHDLKAWWYKVKPGGFISGHDIICPNEHTGGWGKEIQPAVFNFIKYHGVPIKLIAELDGWPWSYILEKPNE